MYRAAARAGRSGRGGAWPCAARADRGTAPRRDRQASTCLSSWRAPPQGRLQPHREGSEPRWQPRPPSARAYPSSASRFAARGVPCALTALGAPRDGRPAACAREKAPGRSSTAPATTRGSRASAGSTSWPAPIRGSRRPRCRPSEARGTTASRWRSSARDGRRPPGLAHRLRPWDRARSGGCVPPAPEDPPAVDFQLSATKESP
jgi:hypothetical protein